jgi:hypothetical protein
MRRVRAKKMRLVALRTNCTSDFVSSRQMWDASGREDITKAIMVF